MFIAIFTCRRPIAEARKYLTEHRLFLYEYYEEELFITSGPTSRIHGGVILIRADSRATVEKVLSRDPYVEHGIGDYRIIEFNATELCFEELRPFLEYV